MGREQGAGWPRGDELLMQYLLFKKILILILISIAESIDDTMFSTAAVKVVELIEDQRMSSVILIREKSPRVSGRLVNT